MNRVSNDLYAIFSSHSDDSLDRFMLPNEKTNHGASNPPSQNDLTTNPPTRNLPDLENGSINGRGSTNQLEKTNPIRRPCDSGDVGATSTSKELSTIMHMIHSFRDNLTLKIPIVKCLYFRGSKQFWITHRNKPHTDYTQPIGIQYQTSRFEFYTGINRQPLLVRDSGKLQSLYNSLGLFKINRGYREHTINECLLQKTYLGAGIKNLVHSKIYNISMELTTMFYHPILASYVYCSFVTLIHTGVVCTVWYKLVPCTGDPMIIPDAISSLSIQQFHINVPVVEGYQSLSFLLTKDIQPLVFDLFANDETFRRVADINEYNQDMLEDEKHQQCLTGFFIAIYICMYITSEILKGGGGG